MTWHLESPTPSDCCERATPAAQPRQPGPWSGIGIVVLYFLLQFGLGALVGAVIALGLAVKAGFAAGIAHVRPNLDVMHALQANPDLRIALTVTTIALAAAVMVLVVRRTWPAQWSRSALPGLGMTRPGNPRAYLVAVLAGFALLLFGGLLTHLLAGSQPLHQDVTVMATHATPGMRVLLALLVVCVVPLVEELVFRGALLSGLASRLPIGWAIVLSALIFGCAHLPDFGFVWYPVPALVLLGLALAWLRVHSGSLWPSMLMHATNNLFAAVMWFLAAHH